MSETWTFPEPEPSKEWDEARRLINETTQKWMRDRVESFERYCVTRIVQIVREEIAKGEPAPPVAPWRFLSDSEKALLDELANCPHDHTNAVVWLGDALTGRPAPPVAERGEWTSTVPTFECRRAWFWHKRPCDSCEIPSTLQVVEVENWIERGERWYTAPWDARRVNVKDATGLWWSIPIVPPLTPDAPSKP